MQMSLIVLTDYLLAIATLGLGIALIRGAAGVPARLWGVAFVALAIGGAFGGTYHALEGGSTDESMVAWIWCINEWFIGLFGLLVVAATTILVFTGATRRFVLTVAALVYLAYVAWTWSHTSFADVLVYNVAVMVFVLAVHLVRLRALPATPWIVAGIAASAVAAAVQASAIAIGVLDHNDLFHLIQLGAMLLLFGGARRLPAGPLHISA
jgi:Family of unknown function (DUF6962)